MDWAVEAIVICCRPSEPTATEQQQQLSRKAVLCIQPPCKRLRVSAAATAARSPQSAVRQARRQSTAACVPEAEAVGKDPVSDGPSASEDCDIAMTPEIQQQLHPSGVVASATASPAGQVASPVAPTLLRSPTAGPPSGLGLPSTPFKTYYNRFIRVCPGCMTSSASLRVVARMMPQCRFTLAFKFQLKRALSDIYDI